jgi:hypothetical protein
MQLPADMVIELADSELVVSERGLPVRKLEFGAFRPAGAVKPPDAAKPADAPSNGAQSVATPVAAAAPMVPAHWDGTRIISDYENRRGGLTRETWELSKDGKQLVIRTALPPAGERPSMEFKRVYDRADQE